MPVLTADKATQGLLCLAAIVCCLSILSGCNTPIDRDNEVNACEFLSANPYLLQTTLATSASPETQARLLSTITIESNNIANARPVATWYWKPYIVKKYRSSSQSYSQGTDATWLDFSRAQNDLSTAIVTTTTYSSSIGTTKAGCNKSKKEHSANRISTYSIMKAQVDIEANAIKTTVYY